MLSPLGLKRAWQSLLSQCVSRAERQQSYVVYKHNYRNSRKRSLMLLIGLVWLSNLPGSGYFLSIRGTYCGLPCPFSFVFPLPMPLFRAYHIRYKLVRINELANKLADATLSTEDMLQFSIISSPKAEAHSQSRPLTRHRIFLALPTHPEGLIGTSVRSKK